MIKYLERHEYRQNGGNKYYIDCNKVEKNTDDIDITGIIRYNKDVAIVSGVLSGIINNKIPKLKSSRHIVVKISHENKTLEKEYRISMKLNEYKIPGYINYICLFSCYDDTYGKDKPMKICKADKKEYNIRKVLIIPYITEGSLRTFKWSDDKFDLLKFAIIQVIMSSFIAFHKIGFIHGDFHLDNILLKKTKQTYIEYNIETAKETKILKINTNGYKIIIIDFEQSWINLDKQQALQIYWNNIYNMFLRLNIELTDSMGNIIKIKDFHILIKYIELQIKNLGDYYNTLQLVRLIKNIKFEIINKPTFAEYNPNV